MIDDDFDFEPLTGWQLVGVWVLILAISGALLFGAYSLVT